MAQPTHAQQVSAGMRAYWRRPGVKAHRRELARRRRRTRLLEMMIARLTRVPEDDLTPSGRERLAQCRAGEAERAAADRADEGRRTRSWRSANGADFYVDESTSAPIPVPATPHTYVEPRVRDADPADVGATVRVPVSPHEDAERRVNAPEPAPLAKVEQPDGEPIRLSTAGEVVEQPRVRGEHDGEQFRIDAAPKVDPSRVIEKEATK